MKLIVEKDFIWQFIEKIVSNREKFLLWILIFISFVYIPLKVVNYGWLPSDDALRHAAHGVNDYKWSDVLVIREECGLDHNHGWHVILRFLHKTFNMDQYDLLYFSMFLFFFLFNITGLLVSKRAISWVVSLSILIFISPFTTFRFIFGRPNIFCLTTAMIILFVWNENIITKKYIRMLLSTILIAFSTWLHGAWYLFFLISCSFFIAGKTKKALYISVSVIIGAFIGSILTGQGTSFLIFNLFKFYNIFSEDITFNASVSEFASGIINIGDVIFPLFLLVALKIKKDYRFIDLTKDPTFILWLLSILLGIKVFRVWLDWGVIAQLYWCSNSISILIDSSESLKIARVKYCLVLFFCIFLFFNYTHDGNYRYSSRSLMKPIDFSAEELIDWAPTENAIIYAIDLRVFYFHYFAYPKGTWKYMLGFEPSFMPIEDLKTYRNIQKEYNEREFRPWIDKMRVEDRIILHSPLKSFEELQWIQASSDFFIGKLKMDSEY